MVPAYQGSMQEITKHEFLAAGAPNTQNPFFPEKAWFEKGALYGVLLFDGDGLWGAVALGKGGEGALHALNISVSIKTKDEAKARLETMMDELARDNIVHQDGPPLTKDLAAEIMAAELGVSREEALARMDLKPEPRNN